MQNQTTTSAGTMKTSADVGKLAGALSKAQSAFQPILKNREAKIPTKSGGSYSYSYADLASIIAATQKPLSENGLATTSAPSNGGVTLVMRLLHSSGEWIEGEYPLPSGAGVDDKVRAAAITYGRRYLLSSLLGIATEDDTDSLPEAPSATYNERKPTINAQRGPSL